ncbi:MULTISPECIES: DMT family transporter [Archaeoglobus]|nr:MULTISPECIES: DMT family transporter [Archaeoglobus]
MLEILMSLTAAICWAFNGIAYRKGVKDVSAFTANFHRTLFATVYFLPLALRDFPGVVIDLQTALVLVISAMLSFYIGDLSYFASLKRSPVSIALPASSTYPVYVVLLSTVIYGAELSLNALISAILVFVAVYIIYGSGEKGETSGLFYALLAAFSWALAILTLDFLTDRLPVSIVAFVRLLLCLILLSFTAKKDELFNRDSVIFSGVLGGFFSFLGIMLFITAIKVSSSWNVVQPSSTSPVFAAIFGAIFLKERISFRLVAGIFVIILAILLLLLPPLQ